MEHEPLVVKDLNLVLELPSPRENYDVSSFYFLLFIETSTLTSPVLSQTQTVGTQITVKEKQSFVYRHYGEAPFPLTL